LGHREENEAAVLQAGVGYLQAGGADYLIVEKQQIEVEGAGAIGCGADAAVGLLDGEHGFEQLVWLELGLEEGGAIEELGLANRATHRAGLAPWGDAEDLGVGDLVEKLNGLGEMAQAVAQIGPECNDGKVVGRVRAHSSQLRTMRAW
jgi:hypothetical protein